MFQAWERPEQEGLYVIGADMCEGLGTTNSDFSVAIVLRRDTLRVVAKLIGQWPPDVFGQMLSELGKAYNEAYLVPEANNVGLPAVLALRGLGYQNLYYRKIYDSAKSRNLLKPGFLTTKKTKFMLVSIVGKYLRSMELRIDDDRLIEELLVFSHLETGGWGAHPGFHDDHVIALALALVGHEELPMDSELSDRPSSLVDRILKNGKSGEDWYAENAIGDGGGWGSRIDNLF